MTFASPKLTYKATFQRDEQHSCFYQVEERDVGKILRRFTVVIPATQKATAKGFKDGAAEKFIERWCEVFPGKLPKDGGSLDADLNEVQKF